MLNALSSSLTCSLRLFLLLSVPERAPCIPFFVHIGPCATGDDPRTRGGLYEIQTATCTATSGTFTLTFRSKTTAAIAYDASAYTVMNALWALQSIDLVEVTFGGSGNHACSSTGVAIAVTFTGNLGDVPMLSAGVGSLVNGAGAGTVTFVETEKGTKENLPCSDRGICDETTGVCKCFQGYSTSDGNGGEGRRGDCGRINDEAPGKCSKTSC